AVESAADLVWEVNTTSGQVEFCYDARGKVFADPGQFRTLADLEQAMHPEDRERFRTAVQQQAQTQGPWHAGFRTVGQDSQVTYWVASGTALPEAEDGSQHWIAVASDVTARRQQEQEQRMEAVSRLAAGLAQEMEQLLAVVLGSAELGLSRAAPSSAVHSNLTAIQQTARSGADLSRRLWAVGRGLEMQPEALDLNARLVEWEQALRQHGGENVQVQFALADNLPLVRADATALEQILCILAERARRVMPDGGTLCVETAAVQIDQAYCSRQPQATPGSYGRLSVADSGMTLDEATCEHLFEPFSVDSAGQPGSELGLAMVYSLLKQLDGWVVLAPQGDAGTCFHLYFPVAAEPAEPSTDAPAPAPEEEASRSVTTQEAAAPTGEPADPTVAPEEPPPAQAVEPASNSAGSSALPEGEAVGPTAGQPAASSTDEPVGPSETQPSGSMPSDPDVAAPQLLRKVKGVLKRGRDRQHER
ncbi:MAG: hypothetical protein FJ026_11445, partial [Chloroflexi bacterium]|nr:hypothetical protein [Chloroflexota bacterium]